MVLGFWRDYLSRRRVYRIPLFLDQIQHSVDRAYGSFSTGKNSSSDPGEWLLDNYYVIQKAILQVKRDINFSFHRELPLALKDAAHEDPTRIFQLCRKLASPPTALISISGTISFLRRFLRTGDLTSGELWAYPVMLRLAVLSNLSDELDSLLAENGEGEGVSSAILNLRKIDETDWKSFFEVVSPVERILRKDPSGVYPGMDFNTRDSYRKRIEELSRHSGEPEKSIASQVIREAEKADWDSPERHCGWFLITGAGQRRLSTLTGLSTTAGKPSEGFLFASMVLSVILCSILFGVLPYMQVTESGVSRWAASLLVLLPSLALGVVAVFQITLGIFPTARLPKMDFSRGVPSDSRTIVVIPAILSRSDQADELVQQLERHFLGNGGENILFGLLTDLNDSSSRTEPEEELVTDALEKGISALNGKHCAGHEPAFFLFHRNRVWNPRENCWMGWERKRGKLLEFNKLLLGAGETTFRDCSTPEGIKYVITLDSDTVLPGGAVATMAGAMAHPLNSRRNGNEMGYTVLQPRTIPHMGNGTPSLFFRVFSGNFAVDLYSNAVSDLYQDVFGQGIYMGKGIYDLESFHTATGDRVPENSLLSHDLLEGIMGRAGYLSDVVVYEDFPDNISEWIIRQHRWIRGDWQLLPWLFRKGFSMLDRWKIADNLRRSLTAPAVLLMILAGWFIAEGRVAVTLSVMAVAVLFRRQLLETMLKPGCCRLNHWLRGLLETVYLPSLAFCSLHAVTITLYRILVSGKHMLQWTCAAAARKKKTPLLVLSTVFAVLTAAIPMAAGVSLPAASVVFLVFWASAPAAGSFERHKAEHRPVESSAPGFRDELMRTALRTWHFFDVFCGPEDHWLPPDHYQEEPLGEVAHRTSPTNIGLFLLSVLGAGEMGFIGVRKVLFRLEDSLRSMNRLTRYRGHILNWHSTRTLEPLEPRYVSTVDSGNLLASLTVINSGLDRVSELSPLSSDRWAGLRARVLMVIDALARIDGASGEPAEEMQSICRSLHDADMGVELLTDLCSRQMNRMDRLLLELLQNNREIMTGVVINQLTIWSDMVRSHLASMLDEIQFLYPWVLRLNSKQAKAIAGISAPQVRKAWAILIQTLPAQPSIKEVLASAPSAEEALSDFEKALSELDPGKVREGCEIWCGKLRRELQESVRNCENLMQSLDRIKDMVRGEIGRMDFGFLYHERKKVFRIGFNAETERPDDNCYDLLASEARIASILSISRREVPFSHWMNLSRPFTISSGSLCLLSWSGTMFEYLMPLLFTGFRSGTLLGQSCRAAVEEQISYGKGKGTPWGISESGYYRFDRGKHYQYMAFGVPGLGFKRGLENDLVISPYSSFLALSVHRSAVMKNLKHLESLGCFGQYGFYEALDFTPGRLPASRRFAPVKSYMAHHQGMILLAILNQLKGNIISKLFLSDPGLRAVEILLQESSSGKPGTIRARPCPTGAASSRKEPSRVEGWPGRSRSAATEFHCLSNGDLNVLVSNRARAWITWKGVDINSRDSPGQTVFIRDMDSGEVIDSCRNARITWYPHRADLLSRQRNITVQTSMTVSPDLDLFIRTASLTNHSRHTGRFLVCSAMEPVLSPEGSYTSHPEFNRLFLRAEHLEDQGMTVFYRRLRSPDEKCAAVGELVAETGRTSYSTDRTDFLGRGKEWERPEALFSGRDLGCRTGTVLDPVLVTAREIELVPEESFTVTFLCICAGDRKRVAMLSRGLQGIDQADTVFKQAGIHACRELDASGVTCSLLKRMQPVLSSLIKPSWTLRADQGILRENTLGQKQLWRFGISGDFPVLLVSADTDNDLHLLGDLLRVYRFWRNRGLMIDLVILNKEHTGYDNELQGRIHRLLSSTGSDDWIGRRAGISLVNLGLISREEHILLQTWASVVLSCSRTLEEQLSDFDLVPVRQPALVPVPVDEPENVPGVSPPDRLLFSRGSGGFSGDGKEYSILLQPGEWLPRPWINVMAGETAGVSVSEAGVQCMWALNSGEYRLIPWRNDPLLDTPGLAIYLRDQETGNYWSPSPLPVRDREPYLIRHSAGYTIWEHNSAGLKQKMTAFMAPEDPVMAVKVSIENPGRANRRIGVTIYTEPVLGRERNKTLPFLITDFRTSWNALVTKNTAGETPPSGVFFIASSRTPNGITCDREEFLGEQSSLSSPAAMKRTGLSGNLRAGMDPCCAMQVMMWIGPCETKEVTFLIGHGETVENSEKLAAQLMPEAVLGTMGSRAAEKWNGILERLQVNTPDRAMDLMVNRWLLYQTISCRMLGRTALYQSSGAYGFRDQLQDSIALCSAWPELTRKHLIRCASRQFRQGDVLHWWHPPGNAGVRTRCSDDLLWLPWAVAEYIELTGDRKLLEEEIPYLTGDPLREDEIERYDGFRESQVRETMHRHCLRALEKGYTRGSHGLPLMGSHDWNDGMNLVGVEGRGESVWLGWFLCDTLRKYGRLCSGSKRIELECQLKELGEALRKNTWDGRWYLRGFYDSGHPLGSSVNDECIIDSIAQTWAVISGEGDKRRNITAMESLDELLIDRTNRLILLFTPPFQDTKRHPGYIMGYPPGVRENGGQYTHAAVWAGWAYAEMGRGDAAYEVFDILNPVRKSFRDINGYRVEPYVVAADVYSSPECPGRGGWTWYTGAAGWLYRLAVEAILGIRMRNGRELVLTPCVPSNWNEWSVTLKHLNSLWYIHFTNPYSRCCGIASMTVNGEAHDGNVIDLSLHASGYENTVKAVLGSTGLPEKGEPL